MSAAVAGAAALPEVHVAAGLPGFPEARQFALVEIEPGGAFSLLRSLDSAGLEFVVAPAAALFPDYAPVIDDDTAASLGISSADDAVVLLILTIDAEHGRVTANLAGPLVVHATTGAAAQVVLLDDEHDLRAPVMLSASASS